MGKVSKEWIKRYPVPDYIILDNSTIPQAGLGIFTTKNIAKNKRLDIYKGVRLTPEGYERKKSYKNYIWAISDSNGEPIEYIDGGNKRKSNWLRYINCPRNKREENVYAVQEDNEIAYYTLRKIKKGEELMVWYGDDYGETLIGLRELPY